MQPRFPDEIGGGWGKEGMEGGELRGPPLVWERGAESRAKWALGRLGYHRAGALSMLGFLTSQDPGLSDAVSGKGGGCSWRPGGRLFLSMNSARAASLHCQSIRRPIQ